MFTAGYQFQVLSPIFSCHWGLQTLNGVYNPWRRTQVTKNSRLLNSFKADLAARYPKINKTC